MGQSDKVSEKKVSTETDPRLHNITSKAENTYRSENGF
jgi:hypothetical protein